MKYPLLQSSEKVWKACCVFCEEIVTVLGFADYLGVRQCEIKCVHLSLIALTVAVLAIQVEGANFAWKNNKVSASSIRSIIIHPEKSSMTAIRHQTYNCEYGKVVITMAPSTVSSVPGSPSGHRLDDEELRDFRPLPRQ